MCDCLDTMEEELVRSKGPVSAVINRVSYVYRRFNEVLQIVDLLGCFHCS